MHLQDNMKKLTKGITLLFILASYFESYSQLFIDNFEGYTVNKYLGPQSGAWTTWNAADGTPEDAMVLNNKAASGTHSIYFHSYNGSGPQDVVLPFGGQYTSGFFKFTANFYVSKDSAAYFNFQGGNKLGVSWPLEFFMDNAGQFKVGPLSGNYPQGKWFEIKVEIDLDKNNWQVFIDNASMGSWSNSINSVSYLNIFDMDPSTEFWVDDVTYCLNKDCNPDLELSNLSISPNPTCANRGTDVILKIKNKGPMAATGFNVSLDFAGQAAINTFVVLKKLMPGKDTTLLLKSLFKSSVVGSNKLKAINMSKDPDAKNDSAFYTLTVISSPGGSDVIKGTVFQGTLRAGTAYQADLLEIGKVNSYELLPPKGYTNYNYNTKWIIGGFTAYTINGTLVPSSFYTLTPPNTSTGSNALFSFTGVKNYLDSTLLFSVSAMDKNTGCDTILQRHLRVVPTPKVNFKFTNPACDGTPIVFENLSTLSSGSMLYNWYFGDGDSSNYEVPVHTYATFGTYCVKLVVTSHTYNIRKDTTLCVTISEIPKVAFKVSNACEGSDINFINQTTIGKGSLSYTWDFGDGSASSNLTNPSHRYASAGGYKVRLSVKSNTGCASVLIKNANQFLKPKADFSVTGNCSKNMVFFTNLTTIGAGDKFGDSWNFGDGTGNNSKNPSHSYSSAGVKSVKYLATSQFGCKDSIIKNITIIPSPEALFTTGQVCNLDPVEFYNSTYEPPGVAVKYLWNFGDGLTSTVKSPKHPCPDLGLRTVNLWATGDNGCSTSFSKVIRVLVQPVAGFNVTDVCAGQEVIFANKTKGSGQITYRWKFGDGDSSTLYLPVKKYKTTASITYNVSLTASIAGGCSNSVSQAVNIYENPKCGFTITSAKTGGYEFIFRPDIPTYPFYQWSFEGGGISNAAVPVHAFPHDGKFRVRVIMRNPDGCTCLDSSQIVSVDHLGIKGINYSQSVKVYPNPNQGAFSVQANDLSPTETYTFQLLDLTGGISTEKELIGNTVHPLQFDHLPSGFYLYRIVFSDGRSWLGKISILRN